MTDEIRTTNASLSTMWALHNFPNLDDFFVISKQLGFQQIELNHQVDSSMLANVRLDHYQFSSVHEPCPSDISVKELVNRDWLISAIHEDDRLQGKKAVKKSIALARQLAAPVVVIHCGTIPFEKGYESKLKDLFNAGNQRTDEYLMLKQQLENSRRSLVGPRLESVKKSLLELLDYAHRFNIKLGLENRYHYMDIPSLEEMSELLNLATSGELGFIYDVGHAQALDRLGFYSHEEWLARFSSRLLGCHLHDIIGVSDHLAPGLGEIDFKWVAKYLTDGIFRTCEILPGNTLAQLRDGLNLLVETGCIRYLESPKELYDAQLF